MAVPLFDAAALELPPRHPARHPIAIMGMRRDAGYIDAEVAATARRIFPLFLVVVIGVAVGVRLAIDQIAGRPLRRLLEGIDAVGKGDLHRLGEQMRGLRCAEPQGANVERLQDVQHLDDVQRPRRRRRRADDLVAAIGAAHRFAFHRAVLGEVSHREVAAGAGHVFGVAGAECAAVQHRWPLARDQAQVVSARRDSTRYSALVQKDYVTRSQADQASATAASAAATADADRAAVERAQVDVSNCTIRAPISGRTGALLVRQGNLVKANASTPMVVINQIQPILVRFSVPQGELPDIQRYFGAAKPLAVQAAPSEGTGSMLSGALAFVDNNVDSTTGTVLLKAKFDNPTSTLWPGQFVNVVTTLTTEPNAIVVPSAAVQNGPQGQYVFVVNADRTAAMQSVTVERTRGEQSVIKEGVRPGQTVVTDGQLRLVAGSQVTIKNDTKVATP